MEAVIDLLSSSYLSLGGVSSLALNVFSFLNPQITSVFLCLDNDQAGNECEKLAGEISGRIQCNSSETITKRLERNSVIKTPTERKQLQKHSQLKLPETEELVPMLCYEDIEQTSVEWLWFPIYPFGKLTIIQGIRERKNLFCNDADSSPYQQKIDSEYGRYRTIQCNLSDYGGWAWRYH